jgi:hypothetical protein
MLESHPLAFKESVSSETARNQLVKILASEVFAIFFRLPWGGSFRAGGISSRTRCSAAGRVVE